MKKIQTFLGALALVLSLVALGSCGEKKKAPSNKTGFEESLTSADSAEVTHLVNQFFEYAQSGKYDEAAGMLYKDNVDSVHNEPQPLDNKGIAEMKSLLSSLPIQSHRIDYLKFSETYANEVKCSAVIMPAHDNVPEVKTVFYFKPVNYLGSWKLCMIDSHNGDRPVVDSDKKDSVQRQYEREMEEKAPKKEKQQ